MPGAYRPFELAPPQMTGVQPIYAKQRPAAEVDETAVTPTWPWGLSALRYSVAYTDKQEGVLGPILGGSGARTLWWQAPQHAVQFRTAGKSASSFKLGLPPLFRARSISSYLPVLPRLPLPTFDANNGSAANTTAVEQWQPILPGGLHYWPLGMRPGVMLAMRHQLQRQSLEGNGSVSSGSVPVQHRTPRPVPLPPNLAERTEIALRTWVSRFEPDKTLHFADTPVDEAFLGSDSNETVAVQAGRLRLTLQHPHRGVLSAGWDRRISFVANVDGITSSTNLGQWRLDVALLVDGAAFACTQDHLDAPRFTIDDSDAGKIKELEKRLAGLRSGDTMNLQVLAWRDSDVADLGFRQALTFPLRVGDEKAHRLPLQPTFLHFEDPEYNRRLASKAVQADAVLQLKNGSIKTSYPVTLAVDRREYNAGSRMALRYDWTGGSTVPTVTSRIELKRVDMAGDERALTYDGGAFKSDVELTSNVWTAGKLAQIPLLDLRQDGQPVRFSNGDTLKVSLTLTGSGGSGSETVSLTVNIVDAPVIPVPEAAYAVLRRQQVPVAGGGLEAQVECVRFAWAPAASRIELICADDLRTGMVRRRAVFQWRDVVRPNTLTGNQYSVQKITLTGATHFPPII